MLRRIARSARWGALPAALLLLGCSTIQFAYNNVDWLLLERADHYLDLNDAQRKQAQGLVRARMEVHRREELPLYVATLVEIRAMLADRLTPEELAIIRERIPALYRRTMRDTIPGIVTLLGGIDDAQVDHLATRFEERNLEFQENFMAKPLEVRLARRVDRSTSMIEFFTGELRADQIALVRRHRNAMPLTAEGWLAYHRTRQQAFLALLRRRASAEELQSFLVGWWVELADQPPALERQMRRNRDAWSEMMLALDATLDARQRQNVLDRLDLFIQELGELIPDNAVRIAPGNLG